jgi:glutamyl-tRNA synthetase
MTEAQRRQAALTRTPAWKIRVPDKTISVTDDHYGLVAQNLLDAEGDFILRRADGVYAYQLAVTVDDRTMGVNRVVRGRDLLSSTPRQVWLLQTMGGTAPTYCHTPLLTAGTGKLSKRLGSLSTQTLRQTVTPERLVGQLAYWCGLLDQPFAVTPQELLPLFSWDKVTKQDIPLDDFSF